MSIEQLLVWLLNHDGCLHVNVWRDSVEVALFGRLGEKVGSVSMVKDRKEAEAAMPHHDYFSRHLDKLCEVFVKKARADLFRKAPAKPPTIS